MKLKAGIIGLPNVGKSTLFNAITNSKILIANYPFATIEPNQGFVSIEDERLNFLADFFKSKNKIENNFMFIDIAGLVKGASKGEGLGNKFLANIREVDAIVHVVRCFENKNILHVNSKINPVEDIETINIELILSDLEIISKRENKIKKKAESTKDKILLQELIWLKEVKQKLNENKIFDHFEENNNLTPKQKEYYKSLGLISIKPILYVANISEKDLNQKDNKYLSELKKHLNKNQTLIVICASLENEITEIENKTEKINFLKALNMEETGLNKIAKKIMNLLNLKIFFTAGEKEARAWTFQKNQTAKEAASIIHSDISRGFIVLEKYKVKDLMIIKDINILKKEGKYKKEGKNYKMEDGDVCYFRFNI